jgi:hypothetical protein
LTRSFVCKEKGRKKKSKSEEEEKRKEAGFFIGRVTSQKQRINHTKKFNSLFHSLFCAQNSKFRRI